MSDGITVKMGEPRWYDVLIDELKNEGGRVRLTDLYDRRDKYVEEYGLSMDDSGACLRNAADKAIKRGKVERVKDDILVLNE